MGGHRLGALEGGGTSPLSRPPPHRNTPPIPMPPPPLQCAVWHWTSPVRPLPPSAMSPMPPPPARTARWPGRTRLPRTRPCPGGGGASTEGGTAMSPALGLCTALVHPLWGGGDAEACGGGAGGHVCLFVEEGGGGCDEGGGAKGWCRGGALVDLPCATPPPSPRATPRHTNTKSTVAKESCGTHTLAGPQKNVLGGGRGGLAAPLPSPPPPRAMPFMCISHLRQKAPPFQIVGGKSSGNCIEEMCLWPLEPPFRCPPPPARQICRGSKAPPPPPHKSSCIHGFHSICPEKILGRLRRHSFPQKSQVGQR